MLRFVVVVMVVAEEVCKSWICLEVVWCVTVFISEVAQGRRIEGSSVESKGPRKELLSPLFFPPGSGKGTPENGEG